MPAVFPNLRCRYQGADFVAPSIKGVFFMRLATVILLLGALLGVGPAAAAYAAPSGGSAPHVAVGRSGHSSGHGDYSGGHGGYSSGHREFSSGGLSRLEVGKGPRKGGSYGDTDGNSHNVKGVWVVMLVLGVFLLVGLIFAVLFVWIKVEERRRRAG
ncbi:hypothetical protein H1V43_24435 [Streptomyces sp. PSKA54]|uniref:Uncharacterized protein n=1 Tax=Streptomyces himalayensis subsp. aureolus TaxID=2758039 RepID=A0A7W2D498_9ACTN|nr:hypothetical protein [Streptomyces himalayensis]MBA4864443.1 hypothetical protein [Streptomyces himalayensis subsp. aureolus]